MQQNEEKCCVVICQLAQSSCDFELFKYSSLWRKSKIFTFFYFFVSVLHKAGRHMEDSIIAAYISLLVGIIIQNNSVSAFYILA